MGTFFAMNHMDLQYAFWALTAVAVVFGNKWVGGVLSRVPGLTSPGGFYSRLLMISVMTCFLTALYYAFDRISNHIPLHIFQKTLNLPITEAQFSVGLALPAALVFFIYPGLGRIGNRVPSPEAKVPEIMQFLGNVVLVVGYYFLGILSLFLARQYLFNILNWFAGRGYPSNTLLFVLGLTFPLSLAGGRLIQYLSERLQNDEGSSSFGYLLLILLGVIVIPASLFDIATGVTALGFWVYFIRQIGWASAVLAGVSFIGAIIINLIGLWADTLKSKQLEGIYTVIPGGLAALIQFGLSNPNMLPK